jgi:hypothetical protein
MSSYGAPGTVYTVLSTIGTKVSNGSQDYVHQTMQGYGGFWQVFSTSVFTINPNGIGAESQTYYQRIN